MNGGNLHHHPPPPPPPPPQPQYIRELPSDLSKEELIKEAEKVIAQTERIKCTVDTPNSLAGIRIQEKLPEGDSILFLYLFTKRVIFHVLLIYYPNLAKKKKIEIII